MQRLGLIALAMLCAGLGAAPNRAGAADYQLFTARQSYSAVLLQQGRVLVDADWNEEDQGPISPGQAFGRFRYDFDQNAIQPLVGAGIVSGLAVGAAPGGSFGGDQGIGLKVTPGLGLTAFGATISVGQFDNLLGDTFRLQVGCPQHCVFVGNLFLQGGSGNLFLGIIADPAFAFDSITIEAVTPRDQNQQPVGRVPDWQLAAITFTSIPEPGTAFLLATGVGLVGARRWYQAKPAGTRRRQACRHGSPVSA